MRTGIFIKYFLVLGAIAFLATGCKKPGAGGGGSGSGGPGGGKGCGRCKGEEGGNPGGGGNVGPISDEFQQSPGINGDVLNNPGANPSGNLPADPSINPGGIHGDGSNGRPGVGDSNQGEQRDVAPAGAEDPFDVELPVEPAEIVGKKCGTLFATDQRPGDKKWEGFYVHENKCVRGARKSAENPYPFTNLEECERALQNGGCTEDPVTDAVQSIGNLASGVFNGISSTKIVAGTAKETITGKSLTGAIIHLYKAPIPKTGVLPAEITNAVVREDGGYGIFLPKDAKDDDEYVMQLVTPDGKTVYPKGATISETDLPSIKLKSFQLVDFEGPLSDESVE